MRNFVILCLMLLPITAFAQGGLDLPYEPPKPYGHVVAPPTNEDDIPVDDDGDDPKDTPPVFFGEELDIEGDALIYVLDLSCSMSLDEPNPYEVDGVIMTGTRRQRALAELALSLDSLAENFKFDIIIYGIAAASWKPELQPATDDNKLSALTWTTNRGCLGMTTTGPTVVWSFTFEGHDHVILLTDGRPNWDGASVRYSEWHRTLIRNRNDGNTIDVFGLHVTGEARTFCQGVASDSGGTFVEIN